MNRFLHIVFCAIWLSLLSNHSIAQSEESDLDCLEFTLVEDLSYGPISDFLSGIPSNLDNALYYSAEADMNADGVNEYFFITDDIFFCGMNWRCKLYARTLDENGNYQDILDRPLLALFSSEVKDPSDPSYSDFLCFSERATTNGWMDLLRSGVSLYTYDGERYIFVRR